jgi:hypothetical protein
MTYGERYRRKEEPKSSHERVKEMGRGGNFTAASTTGEKEKEEVIE